LAVGDVHFARTCEESGVLRQSTCHYQKRRATYRDILERRTRENQIDFIEGVADEDVVDQFLASSIDAAEALGFGDAWGQIPQPLRVAV
jgi:hypothetical protein